MTVSGIAVRRVDANAIARIEISNPPINLVDVRFVAELTALVDALETDDAVKVVVFRSALPDYFVNHYDMAPRANGRNPSERVDQNASDEPECPRSVRTDRAGDPRPVCRSVQRVDFDRPSEPLFRLFVRLSRLPQVTIAEIRGRTRGAGSEFAQALDMRFASRERALFGQPEVGIGLHPGAGGTQRLPALMGRARALEVMLSGSDYSADVAEQYGWVNRALPDAEVTGWVDDLAARIASFPAIGLRNVKRFVNSSFAPADAALEAEAAAFRETLAHREVRERLAWLFARGAQLPGDLERDLGGSLARFGR